MTNAVFNGNAYSDDGSSSRDMLGGGHRQWLLPMLSDAVTDVSAKASQTATSAGQAVASEQATAQHKSAAAQSAANAAQSASVAAGSAAQAEGVVTQAEARLRTNLVPRTNLIPDAGYWGLSGFTVGEIADWGVGAYTATLPGGATTGSVGVRFQVQPGISYTVTGDSLLFVSSGAVSFTLDFYNDNNVLLGRAVPKRVSGHHDFNAFGANRAAHETSAVAPAGATYAICGFQWENLSDFTLMGFRQVKAERGGLPATPYSLEGQAFHLQHNIPKGTSAKLNVPSLAGASAAATEVVRGDDPRLTGAPVRGSMTLTASQAVNKSTFGTATYLFVELWGGGSSGGAGVNNAATGGANRSGGEGGEYASFLIRIADLAAATNAVVGAGGAAVTITGTGSVASLPGNPGGDTSVGGYVAKGGSVDMTGLGVTAGSLGSNKGGLFGKNGGAGGGYGSTAAISARTVPGGGGNSIYGGAGGGGSHPEAAGAYNVAGSSVYGGNGGAGVNTGVSGSTAPSGASRGGGGGGIQLTAANYLGTVTSGAGGRGEIKLTWW